MLRHLFACFVLSFVREGIGEGLCTNEVAQSWVETRWCTGLRERSNEEFCANGLVRKYLQ